MIEKRFFNSVFRFWKYKGSAFIWLTSMFHENYVLRHQGASDMSKNIFLILTRHFESWRHHSKCWRLEFPLVILSNWWKVEKFMLISFLYQTLWVIQFVRKLLGIWNVRLRNCKYLKNDEWLKHVFFTKLFK